MAKVKIIKRKKGIYTIYRNDEYVGDFYKSRGSFVAGDRTEFNKKKDCVNHMLMKYEKEN